MSKNVTVNGVDYTGVSQVQLPPTAGGTALFKDVDEIITPSGSVTLTENGTHDVSAYAQAVVDVAAGGSDGDDNTADFLTTIIEGKRILTEDVHFTVPNGVKTIRDGAFQHLTKDSSTGYMYITLPDTVEEIGGKAFYYSPNCVIGALPKNLKIIRSDAFRQARNVFYGLTELKVPASVETLDLLAFYQYNGNVKTITFEGTPTSIANNAFQNSSFTTINVPWAEGAVANAPWGAASDVTINYNYTGA